ncbi:MAG: outer membrane protein transport protein [Deltaproteobacteria bacterium]|nr:outer membrane protein transport protein [Deltaproteobacteria bacterium]
MKRGTRYTLLALCAALTLASPAFATNGDNLMAIGPIARSMGGVGIADPQDAISAVFSNPAAMCFGDWCPSTGMDFAATLFMPEVSTEITRPGQVIRSESDDSVYAIPAIGLSVPLSKNAPEWRFGLAAYGVSGLGVNYKKTDLESATLMPGAPLVAATYTELQIMKFAPAISYQVSDKWSLGLALNADYATLDLGSGGAAGYGFGAQLGAIFRPTDKLSFGLTYTTPQTVTHDAVTDFDGDGKWDDLKLQAPQQAGFGAAVSLFENKVLLEADVKWINWANADGYEDFDWNDQTVLGLGLQVKPTRALALRLGYNYSENPLEEHENFNGVFGQTTLIQGKEVPTYYYETFRLVGFPAITKHHLTFGAGYAFTERFTVNLAYTHGFEETMTEKGVDMTGQPVTLASTLTEQSFDFGLSWKF